MKYISKVKKEAPWILDFRLKALEIFQKKPMPTNWADKDLENIHFDKIRYYLSKGQVPARSWDDVPDDVKETFERLGIPEQERKFLAGVEAQFDSEASYSRMKEDLEKARRHFRRFNRRSGKVSGDFPPLLRQSHPQFGQ